MDQKHPINSVMQTALENIKDMIDVNTVVGDPVVTGSGGTVIPVSKVSFGFVAGGGEYAQNNPEKPFAGGSGAGVSLQPVGFLVLGEDGVHMLPAQNTLPFEHAVSMLPKLISDVKALFSPSDEKNGGDMEENA
ncbi:MAG: GerW family sporulation protein [Clostridia bacterium]|nr:GerW family sporulation protein [Clostridia bacterium]